MGLLTAEPSRALLSFLFACAVCSRGLEFHKCVSSRQLHRIQSCPGHTPPDGLLQKTPLWTQRVGLKRVKTSDFRSVCFAGEDKTVNNRDEIIVSIISVDWDKCTKRNKHSHRTVHHDKPLSCKLHPGSSEPSSALTLAPSLLHWQSLVSARILPSPLRCLSPPAPSDHLACFQHEPC